MSSFENFLQGREIYHRQILSHIKSDYGVLEVLKQYPIGTPFFNDIFERVKVVDNEAKPTITEVRIVDLVEDFE